MCRGFSWRGAASCPGHGEPCRAKRRVHSTGATGASQGDEAGTKGCAQSGHAKPGPDGRCAPGATVGALPNQASAISETYGDWTLNCGTDKGAKFCTLSQAQVNKEGQRAFAVELRTSKDGSSEGSILMPFGLKLDAGVILRLDDKDIGQGLRFSTCLAQGCLLPVSFPSAGIDAIRNARTFTVGALNMSNNQLVTFNVSLNGFAVALDRAVQVVS